MWCIWCFKDTNSKANHNNAVNILADCDGVFGVSKIQIQKQITTYAMNDREIEWCIWCFKDTNSKANHNSSFTFHAWITGVFGVSKIQIQKQITTRFKWYTARI